MKLRDLLFNTVLFEAEGGNSERFLSACMRDFVPVTQVQATPLGFRARVPAARYRQLHAPARAARCRLHVVQKQGPRFYAKGLLRHTGVLLGLLAVALLTLLGPDLVWNIEYYALDSAAVQELSDRLFSCGVYQGCFASDALLRSAEQKILMDSDRFAALSLNYAKGKLVVEASLTTPAPVLYATQPQDIRAATDGVVRTVEVYNGVGAVLPGQTVQKGDVLVSASWQGQDGAPHAAPCRARVMAYVERTCTTACPLVQDAEVVTGTRTDSLALCVGPWRLWLKKGEDPAAVPAQQGLRLLGFSLPVTVFKTLCTETEPQQLVLSRQEAEQRCVDTLNALLYAELPELQILSRECSFTADDTAVYCTMTVRAYADIAERTQAG